MHDPFQKPSAASSSPNGEGGRNGQSHGPISRDTETGPKAAAFDVFLSYASEEAKEAKAFAEALRERGLRVYWNTNLDPIHSRQDFRTHFQTAFRESRLRVLLLSPSYFERPMTRFEMSKILVEAQNRNGSFVAVKIRRFGPQYAIWEQKLQRGLLLALQEENWQPIVDKVFELVKEAPEEAPPVDFSLHRDQWYHVFTQNGHWALKGESRQRATKLYEKRDDAIEAGRQLVKRGTAGKLFVHRPDGTVEEAYPSL